LFLVPLCLLQLYRNQDQYFTYATQSNILKLRHENTEWEDIHKDCIFCKFERISLICKIDACMILSSCTQLVQSTSTLFLPLLLGYPHAFLVGHLNTSVSFFDSSMRKGFLRGKLTMFARTAPPKKTMCLLLGGSSILTLNFCLLVLR
jgi:hypothetical protein